MRTPPRPSCACTRLLVSLALALQLQGAAPAAAAPAVQWRELGPPARAQHAMVWDSRRDRALILGGDFATDRDFQAAGVWQLVRDAHPRWIPFPALGPEPPPRSGVSAIYDSLRDRVLVFGGRSGYRGPGSNELWALSLSGTPQWSQLDLSAGPNPPPRWCASLVLDAEDRLVLFGGDGAAAADSDVWILPLSPPPLHWQDVPLAGQGPGPRARHGAVYSAATHRMTVFGGDRLIVSGGGIQDFPLRPAVTWELALDAPLHWIQRATAPGDSVPIPETGGPLVADRAGDAAWLVPGDQGYDANDASVWHLDLHTSAWTRMSVSPGGPGLCFGAAASIVPGAGELLLQGGAGPAPLGQSLFGTPASHTSTSWSLALGAPAAWSIAAPVPEQSPPPTTDPRLHLDSATRRLITWSPSGVWTSDLASDGAWLLAPEGAVNAPPWKNAVSVLDPVRRRLLVFGGVDGSGHVVAASQLWSWPLDGPGGWSTIAIAGGPERVWGRQNVYDPARDRVVVVRSGALNVSVVASTDTVIALTLGGGGPEWSRIVTQGTAPSMRQGAGVVLDVARDRLIVQGGLGVDIDPPTMRDVWTLSLSGTPAWSNPIPSNFDPQIGAFAGVVLDPTLDRLLMFGGVGGGYKNTVYASPLGGPPGWTDLDPDDTSPLIGYGTGFYDAALDRALFWNGTLWEVTWAFGSPVALGSGTAAADESGVHLHWSGPVVAPYAATIERTADGGGSWSFLAIVSEQPDGSLDATDPAPPAGGPFVYRAVIERGGDLRVLGSAALGNLSAPVTDRPRAFALAPLRPNPSRGDVTLELASPTDADVSVEVFDTSGRRVAAALHRRVAAGRLAFTAPLARGLAPGVYLVRASDGAHEVRSRLAVVR